MNRAQRRAAGIKERKHRISLEEWRADPDKFITRADAMALVRLHEVNKHARTSWWRRLIRWFDPTYGYDFDKHGDLKRGR